MTYNLTAAIIGSGYIGKRHIAAYKKLGLNIVVCSNDIENGQNLANEYNARFYEDYNEMFKKEKLDLVSVCLPTFLHYDATMAALDNNVNVLCEKPFTLNPEEAERMVKRAKEKNLLLMVGHCVRFMQQYEYLKHRIKDFRFGKLTYLNLYRHGNMPAWSKGNWFAKANLSGGALRDFHVHDTDMVLNLLGMPASVFTTGNYFGCNTVYEFGKGLAVNSSSSWRNVKDCLPQMGFDAIFEKGSVVFRNGIFNVYNEDGEIKDALEKESFGEFYAPLGESGLEYEVKYFCYCLTNNILPEICLPDDSIKTVIINKKETDSIDNNQKIEI